MEIKALFQQPNVLPTAPKVVQELIVSFNDEGVSIGDIARKLSADPVLSAKLLRLANSAYYHVSRSISTVDHAVAMLGFVTVRTLVISSSLVHGFKSTPGLDLKQFWRYSLHTAVAAKWLANRVDENSDLAFTVGMLHGIGELMIHAGMPERALQLDKLVSYLDERRFITEFDTFGYDYSEVSAELASRWNFPEDFSAAIRAFPKPLEHQPFNPMAAIIHLAGWIARANENDITLEEIRSSCPTEVCAKFDLDPYVMLDEMPPLAELSSGLEELVS